MNKNQRRKNMKTQKRLLTWILVAVLVVTALALVACVDKPRPVQLTELKLPELKDNQMAVIIKNGDNDYTSYVVTLGTGGTDATTAEGVIQYLHDEADLTVNWTDSEFGKYLHGIGGISEDTANSAYVIVFTSVVKDQGTYAGVTTYDVGDVTIVEAGVGISSMTVEAGAVIYFEIVSYAF